MATQTIITRTDSLDERISSEVEDVVFFDPRTGQKLEIQLGAANRKHFENHLARLDKYIAAAEVVAEPVVSKPKAAAKNSETTKIREWAKANGFQIGDRGRIKAEIMQAYKAAHEVISEQAESVSDVVELGNLIDEVDSRQDEAELSTELFDAEHGTDAPEEGFISGDDVMALLDEVTGNAPDAVSVSTVAEIEAAVEAGHLSQEDAIELLDQSINQE